MVANRLDITLEGPAAATLQEPYDSYSLEADSQEEPDDQDANTVDDKASWDEAEPATIATMRSPAKLGSLVRAAASIVSMRTPALREMGGERTLVTSLVLKDPAGDEMETTDVFGEDVIAHVAECFKRGKLVEVISRMCAPGLENTRRFQVQLIDVRRANSILDILGATGDERTQALELLERLSLDGISPLDYIFELLCDRLRIVGLEQNPLLGQLIRFTVLQALSGGHIGHASARLSGLVIGPPAQGKKLIGLAAGVLNPRVCEASSSKISAAGLIGASVKKGALWTTQPGLFALADEGVVVLQDAHGIQRAELNKLAGALQELMEDGVIRDSKAGGVRQETSVGLLIDMNRTSHLGTTARSGNEAPIARLRPLLSRFDLIAELPTDPSRAWAVGAEMYGNLSVSAGRVEDESWIRPLRVLVGTLRDLHAEVKLDAVTSMMQAWHEKLAEMNEDLIATTPEAGDIPTRMVNTFGRYVIASARANDRSVATEDDVAEAVSFLRPP